MASKSLGVLTLDLVAKTGAFVKGMDQAERKARSSLGNIEKRATAFGKALGTALGLSLAGIATGAVAALKGAIDRMDELRDASIRLGVGVETLSAFSYAAQQTGTDIDALGKGLKILAKNAADALNPKSTKFQLFESIGVAVKDQAGNLRDLDELLFDVADRYQLLEDGTTKAALAQELFGKSGLDLTEFLNQGSDGLREMTDRARELGLVIDQEAADKADKFNDTINDLKGSVTGLATDVAIELLPQLTEMVEWAGEWVRDGDNAGKTAREIGSGIRDMADAVKSLGEVLGFLEDLKTGLDNVQQSMVNGNWLTIARKQFQEQAFGRSGDFDIHGFVDEKRKGPAPNVSIPGMAFRVPGVDSTPGFSAIPFSAVDRSKRSIDRSALNRALGGDTGTDPKKKKGGGGKSDAEKAAEEAKRLAEQARGDIEALNAQYAEQIALFGEVSEAAKLRYQFEHEDITKLDAETQAFVKTQREQAVANAEQLDQLREEKDVKEELDRIDKQRREAVGQVLDDIKTEQDLLGKSAEYQDTYNKLKYAGVDANSAFGQSIIEANHALHEQAKVTADQIDTMDALRDSSRNFLEEWKDSGDIWTSAKDAVDSFFDALFRIITNRMIEKALGENGTTGGGGFGDWIGKAASLFFSSGSSAGGGGGGGFLNGSFAIGGTAAAGGLYRVNENAFRDGPEMLSMGGRDYLMMGAQSGQVTPPKNSPTRTRGGDTFNFNIRGPNDSATRDQALGLTDALQRRQRVRNGKR